MSALDRGAAPDRKLPRRLIVDELAADGIHVSAATVHRWLRRLGISRLRNLDVTGNSHRLVRRIETDRPGQLVHVDVKKIGAIPTGGGWRVHGRGSSQDRAARKEKVGYRYWHSAIDAHTRLAFTESLDDEKAVTAAGFLRRATTLKVGGSVEDDVRRCSIAREVIGPDRRLMVDANQVWDVGQAITWMAALEPFGLWWIEEPTSPDDVLGHAAVARVATGEHVQNRVVFKQLLQAGSVSICQIDACRVAGVNEVVAVLLLAAKFGVPVCPHAGGVGLCELVVHLAVFDAIAVGGEQPDRVVEYVDHLHEHFIEPTVVREGWYRLPEQPGYATMLEESRARFRYPDGAAWAGT